MSHSRRYWLEKLQVQIAAAACLAVVYFVTWPAFRPSDPAEPISFLADGSISRMFVFGLLLSALAAGGAVLTISARPSGALLAALVGAAGLSLRTEPIRGLLWLRQQDMSALYYELLLEVIVLGLLVCAAAVAAGLLRRWLTAVMPRWVWQVTLGDGAESGGSQADDSDVTTDQWLTLQTLGLAEAGTLKLFALFAKCRTKDDQSAQASVRKAVFARSVGCLLLGMLLATVLLVVLMQSTDRGQLLFGLFAGFLLATLAAHQLFPTPCMAVAWVMPILVGIGFYLLAGFSVFSGPGEVWLKVPFYARALPIDWLSAGGAGSLVGYWMSWRKHEQRIAEEIEAKYAS